MLAQPPPLSDAAEATPDTWQTALDNALEYLDQEGAENVALAAPPIKKVFTDALPGLFLRPVSFEIRIELREQCIYPNRRLLPRKPKSAEII